MTRPSRVTGMLCGGYVGPVGLGASYPCVLGRGHGTRPTRSGQPEPCYATEVRSSVAAWERWHEMEETTTVERPLSPPGRLTPTDGHAHDVAAQFAQATEHGRTLAEDRAGSDYALPRPTPAAAKDLRQREGDQPLPVPNDLPGAHDLVISDLKARRELGLKRYGSLLQAFNGRRTLVDGYEEILDLAVYQRALIEMVNARRDQLVGVAYDALHRAAIEGRLAISLPPPFHDFAAVVVDAILEAVAVGHPDSSAGVDGTTPR